MSRKGYRFLKPMDPGKSLDKLEYEADKALYDTLADDDPETLIKLGLDPNDPPKDPDRRNPPQGGSGVSRKVKSYQPPLVGTHMKNCRLCGVSFRGGNMPAKRKGYCSIPCYQKGSTLDATVREYYRSRSTQSQMLRRG